mmetsp:Transcript_29472/g.84365  ORF Transcript_29472/g.84365 Transcript_29472/m.84365 type:complete len:267 (+) Transcript_29472:233-1033(+)
MFHVVLHCQDSAARKLGGEVVQSLVHLLCRLHVVHAFGLEDHVEDAVLAERQGLQPVQVQGDGPPLPAHSELRAVVGAKGPKVQQLRHEPRLSQQAVQRAAARPCIQEAPDLAAGDEVPELLPELLLLEVAFRGVVGSEGVAAVGAVALRPARLAWRDLHDVPQRHRTQPPHAQVLLPQDGRLPPWLRHRHEAVGHERLAAGQANRAKPGAAVGARGQASAHARSPPEDVLECSWLQDGNGQSTAAQQLLPRRRRQCQEPGRRQQS